MLDANNDGDITEEEFMKGCMNYDDLVQELAGKSKENEISAHADGGHCSRVCARETLRSAPHRH